MPSVSEKQHRMMEAVAHDPKFAKKVGVPQKVGKEYAAADTAKSSGGFKGAAQDSAKRAVEAKTKLGMKK